MMTKPDQTIIDESTHFDKIMGKIIARMPPVELDDGNVQMKVAIFYDAIQGLKCCIPEHEHPFYEIGWMINGTMAYRVDEKKIFNTLKNRQIIIIPSGIRHLRSSDDDSLPIIRTFEISISPTNKNGESFIIRLNKALESIGYCVKPSEAQLAYLDRIESHVSRPGRFSVQIIQFEIFSFLLELLQFVMEHAPDAPNMSYSGHYSHGDIANYIKMRIEDLINRPCETALLEEYFGLSARQLNRIFVKEMGISIGKYAVTRRIFHAERLLSNPSNSISDVANALGFNNISYFYSFFKKHKKMTPGEFKKRLKS